MASPLRFDDLKRKCSHFEITIKSGGRGSHFILTRMTSNGTRAYPIPVHHGKVKAIYIPKLRRILELTPEHGVSDKEFDEA